ncbi:colicin-A, partial [Salmonella enterica subsp. enterica]|uniref:colicin-like pore-forming protein n=1 Tax=Salmonella enterica TaxID=28901 RepID=UPI000DE68F16
DTKQNEINAAVANRDGLNSQLSQANNVLQNARNEKSAADAALSAATAQRLQAEAALRAAAEAAEKARQRQAEEAERQRQAMEVAEKAKDEREVLEKTSELIAGMGDKIGEHLGDKYKSIAKDIADNIKNFQGRSLRSFDDAMASLNKITANPAMKINKADRDALVNAWKQVDAQEMANKLGNLSKAFKVADVVMKVEKVREKSIEGYETGNWRPLMLEVESWVLSGMATGVAMGLFGAILSMLSLSGLALTAITISGIMVISYLASKIDAEMAEEINKDVIDFI